ncbi:hypothetical protein HOD05_00755 [Candidatus Woesearchaeota archaeon]|jgi:hypothetical protein|nr:hypothetical protein [Candidatus Woesearchaeota archaeon]MBT4150936.1 hypothetical protein [Candidatus Woesearchaeota archaeon]MBT4247089.1 hypothetical protein [Candidatus Woesearchaeota archaeon]MBT4433726.1 hypothetical protein [Candidatus Woesearchaeota archaeon]
MIDKETKVMGGIVGLLAAGAIAYATIIPSELEHKRYEGMLDGKKVTYSVDDFGSDLPLQDTCFLNVYKVFKDERTEREFRVKDINCDNTANEVTSFTDGRKEETYSRDEIVYGKKVGKYDSLLAKVQDKFTNPKHDADAKHQRMMKNL